ncbi:DUF4233 domain-containing protein [Planctomonas deserti]|uniref:DUF4233 domain-containing protein n=1 Tax=Planctomonas deserti TaxID=2144185 RepID=UPI000D3D772A|nr:DUF4233 domain-containing protein [Planctomonas deserti]
MTVGTPDPSPEPGRASRPARRRRTRSTQESLGSIVLGFEVIVVFLAALVAFGLRALPAATALGGGAALIAVMLVTVGLLRYRWGFALGWLVELAIVATGFVLQAMFIVGGFFAILWVYCMIQGARIDREKAAALRAQPDAGPTVDGPTETI